MPVSTTKDTGADQETEGSKQIKTSSSGKPVKSQIERFNQMFQRDIQIYKQGGIPKFQRVNFLRKIEQGFNQPEDGEGDRP